MTLQRLVERSCYHGEKNQCPPRSIRRERDYFDCRPNKLKPEQLENDFANLVKSHSWSTVKMNRLGPQHFWKFVLKKQWEWLNIVKPPKVKIIPDILIPDDVA